MQVITTLSITKGKKRKQTFCGNYPVIKTTFHTIKTFIFKILHWDKIVKYFDLDYILVKFLSFLQIISIRRLIGSPSILFELYSCLCYNFFNFVNGRYLEFICKGSSLEFFIVFGCSLEGFVIYAARRLSSFVSDT